MSDEQYVTKIPAGNDYNLTFQTKKDHQNDIHYIGIFTNMVSEFIKYRKYNKPKINRHIGIIPNYFQILL